METDTPHLLIVELQLNVILQCGAFLWGNKVVVLMAYKYGYINGQSGGVLKALQINRWMERNVSEFKH